MKLEMEVISTEVITPSSSTPHHLIHYKLSFLDQIIPAFLTPFIFLYPANGNIIRNSERSNHLKKSLSQALTLFYPLAGRLVGSSYVNCNDEGVTYVEAQANNHNLIDVITDPNPEKLNKLIPCDPVDAAKKDHCMVVQATYFSCGGLALGLGISHKVVDGFSYNMFLNSWASFSRGGPVQPPKLESAVLFPPEEDFVREMDVIEKKENMVTKRFVFSSAKITKLRHSYTKRNTKDEGSICPTRIEALSVFIGTRFMVATMIRSKDDTTTKPFALRIYVDIRTRVVPPLSEYHFGNMIIPAIITMPSLESNGTDGSSIVKKMRDAILNVDQDSVAQYKASGSEVAAGANMLSFTNLCNLPVNKVNFGWGIPMMIGGPNIPINNMVFFTNSLSGNGIDAWVNLKEEDMIKFEADKELLEYVSDTNFMSRI